MINMIVWDCDGTLIDASRMIDLLYSGYHQLFPNRKPLPREHFIPCYYYTDKETKRYLHIPQSDQALFYEVCFGLNGEKMQDVQAFKHIVRVILQLDQMGIHQGVNTSRNHNTWNDAIRQLGDEAFHTLRTVVTQEEIKHPKPAPDSLYYLLELTGYQTHEILFVGDSINDALCAKQAKIPFAYASWGEVVPQTIPYQYRLRHPQDIFTILKQVNQNK